MPPTSAVNKNATKPRKGPYDDRRSRYSPISTRRLFSLTAVLHHGLSSIRVLLLLVLCVFRTINGPLVDELVRHFSLSAGSLGIITSTYLLALALSAIPIGVALDAFGPRLVQFWVDDRGCNRCVVVRHGYEPLLLFLGHFFWCGFG